MRPRVLACRASRSEGSWVGKAAAADFETGQLDAVSRARRAPVSEAVQERALETARPATPEPASTSEICRFLEGRTLFVTGATGFLAKLLVEKVLYEQPRVRKIYLLVRGGGSQERARQRLEESLMGSALFDRLRAAHGAEYEEFMRSKLEAVDGSMEADGLGIAGAVRERLEDEVDVVVNSAATTTFDERYDLAVGVNTLGAQRCLELARRCRRLRVLVHVSTAFTNGLREGHTRESLFEDGATIKAEASTSSGRLDVDAEVARAQGLGAAVRARLRAAGMGEEEAEAAAEAALRDEGMRAARERGWQDTYVFTKAMGEMLVRRGAEAAGVPCCVVRPSIVESSYREPLPGWIEGIRMADPILLAYGKGQIAGFAADRDGVLDVVPADYVINAILAAMPRHARGFGERPMSVYHVATSAAKPLTIRNFVDAVSRHFKREPFLNKDGSPVALRPMAVFPSSEAFITYAQTNYLLPALLAKLSQDLPWAKGSSEMRKMSIVGRKTFEQLTYLCQIYTAYSFYRCRFGVDNTWGMFEELNEEDKRRFNFDFEDLDWDDYMERVHIPGLRKYVLKGRQ